MAKKTTKTIKKQQPIRVMVKNPSLSEYFKTPEITAETLEALRTLGKSTGWKVLQAFIKEQQLAIASTLLKVKPDDALTVATLQNQNKVREELSTLPSELIKLITENTNPKNFDPYN